MNKAIEWCKQHKKEIFLGSTLAITAGVLAYFGINTKQEPIAVHPPSMSVKPIDVKFEVGTVTEAKEWGDGLYDVILNDFKPRDLGKIGEEFVKNIPGVTEDTVLTAIIGTTI